LHCRLLLCLYCFLLSYLTVFIIVAGQSFFSVCTFEYLHICLFADSEKSVVQKVLFCLSAGKGKEEKQAIFLLALSGGCLLPLAI
jgi:hypothetical protein